jgi:hypothetical protein
VFRRARSVTSPVGLLVETQPVGQDVRGHVDEQPALEERVPTQPVERIVGGQAELLGEHASGHVHLVVPRHRHPETSCRGLTLDLGGGAGRILEAQEHQRRGLGQFAPRGEGLGIERGRGRAVGAQVPSRSDANLKGNTNTARACECSTARET